MNEAPRVLITNQAMRLPTGTERYVRDLALQLLKRGWRPVVYSPNHGPVADELRKLTVPVIDRLDRLTATPDVIHGHHNHPTLTALSHFPITPALLFCHDWDAWHDEPVLHPRIRRYVAVDETCRDRLQCLEGVPPERIVTVPNWADTSRFTPRDPLPARPTRALLFSNLVKLSGRRDVFRQACDAEGVQVEVAGLATGRLLNKPEEVLGDYDLVFAKGKSAMEALAVGAAVVLHGFGRLGPLVTSENFERLRSQNFGRRAIDTPVSASAIRQRLAEYNAADATRVSHRFRDACDLKPTIDRIVSVYKQVIQEYRSNPGDPGEESRAVAAYLARTQLMVEYGAKRWRRKQREQELSESARGPLRRVARLFGRAA